MNKKGIWAAPGGKPELSVQAQYTETQFEDAQVQQESRLYGMGVRPVTK